MESFLRIHALEKSYIVKIENFLGGLKIEKYGGFQRSEVVLLMIVIQNCSFRLHKSVEFWMITFGDV